MVFTLPSSSPSLCSRTSDVKLKFSKTYVTDDNHHPFTSIFPTPPPPKKTPLLFSVPLDHLDVPLPHTWDEGQCTLVSPSVYSEISCRVCDSSWFQWFHDNSIPDGLSWSESQTDLPGYVMVGSTELKRPLSCFCLLVLVLLLVVVGLLSKQITIDWIMIRSVPH